MKKLTDIEIGYIAGLIDGEGHLYIRGEYEKCCYGVVRIRITDKKVVLKLKKITGIGVINSYIPKQRRKDGGEKRRVFEWLVIKKEDLKELVLQIYNSLVAKKIQAICILKLFELKEQGIHCGYHVEKLRQIIAKRACK